jgi:hypothetical protein
MLIAAAVVAMPLGGSFASEYIPRTPTPTSSQGTHHAEPWGVVCIMGAATAEIIGAVAHGNDKNDPRQSTIFEAGWYAAACPALLPLALVVSATCPDNKATYEIARQAHRYGLTHQPADWTPFTNAYGEACRTGKLSRDFRAFLKANGLKLSAAYRRG